MSYLQTYRPTNGAMILCGSGGPYCSVDDPAIVEALRKAELYDKGDAEWRAQLEAQYRTTIESLKAQCIAYGKEHVDLKRDSDALRKLERMLANNYYLHIIRFNDGAVAINGCDAGGSKSITDPDNVPDTLRSAIELAVKEPR